MNFKINLFLRFLYIISFLLSTSTIALSQISSCEIEKTKTVQKCDKKREKCINTKEENLQQHKEENKNIFKEKKEQKYSTSNDRNNGILKFTIDPRLKSFFSKTYFVINTYCERNRLSKKKLYSLLISEIQ